MAAAVVAMPILAARLGVDRLGVLSLAWVVIGYFSLFDLGVGRATTKVVASRIAAGRRAEVPGLVATSLALLLVLGCAGGAILAALAPWLADRALQVPAALQQESRQAFYLLALTVPLVVVSSGLRGVLEAERRFAALSVLRVALGLISFIGPLLVLPFSQSLVAVVLVLAAGRVALLSSTLALCRHALPGRGSLGGLDRAVTRELLHFGGWLTVSNVVGPFLVLLDRFVVGAVVSIGAVAYYATPLEVVQRTGVVPIAIGTVVFPAMAATSLADSREARALLSTALRLSLAGIFPILFLLALWAHQGLDVWLGEAFARESTTVVRWVTLGLLLNALGCASLFALQASGRPDLPAKFHVLELVGYVPLLWWLTESRGLEGAAMAWTARVGIDAVLLVLAAVIRFSLTLRSILPLLVATGLGLACLVLASWLEATAVKAIASVAVPAVYLALCFTSLLTADERATVRGLLGRLR
jgi:O-antigen/teichoic acid export membrane protein